MSVNDEFNLGKELELEITAPAKAPARAARPGKKVVVSAKKQAMLDAIMATDDDELDALPAPVGATALDEGRKKSAGDVLIIIDEMAGVKENYEVVAVNGVVFQIKRGSPVAVPPEVVHVLELAQMTHIEQRKNPYSGDLEEVTRNFSAIPWRRA